MARVTLVNDSDDFLAVMADVLAEGGHQCQALRGSTHSIDEVAATRPDLLIIDLVLGSAAQVDGWGLVVGSRAHPGLANVPIVLCSADVVALRRRADEISALADVHVLEKPFTLAVVEDLIATLLNRPTAFPAADEAFKWAEEGRP